MAISDTDARLVLNSSAALVALLFAVVVWAGGPRRVANRFLALFLFLIAGNQAAEALLLVPAFDSYEQRLFHVASVFAAFDPFFLYYFASVYPERNRLNRTRYVALVLAGGILLALLSPLMSREPLGGTRTVATHHVTTLLSLYSALVYSIVLMAIMRPLLAGSRNPALRWLYAGLCIAVIPSWGRMSNDLVGSATIANGPLSRVPPNAAWIVTAVPIFALVAATGWMIFAAHRAPGPTRALRRWLFLAPLAGFVMAFLIFQVAPHLADPLQVSFVGRSSAAFRWILFSVLVSVAILRYQMLGMSLAARRVSARVLVGVAFAALAFAIIKGAQVVVGGQPLRLTALDAIILGLVVASSQAFRRLLDVVAEKLYGVPRPGRLAGRLEAYQSAVAQVQREGRSPVTDPELFRLRAELNLDPETASVIERMAIASNEGLLVTGELVSGRYRVERFLGRGSGGRAFLARDEVLQRRVVLKEILQQDGEPSSPDWTEARVAGSIGHPNVVTVHDVLSRRGANLIVSEYVAGGTLEDRLASGAPLTLREGWRLADGILAGLAAVHVRKIIHQDLKPSNILLLEDGTPKIADFGIARLIRGHTLDPAQGGPVRGTPQYMAPETKAGRASTPATDLYAAGKLIRRLLSSAPSAKVETVLRRSLAARPEDRWQSANEMRAALDEAVREDLTRGTRESNGRRRPRRPK